jgi:hypothetical protein
MKITPGTRTAWAIGTQQRNGFHIRRIVWGRTLARMERRIGEAIVRVEIAVAAKKTPHIATHLMQTEDLR